MTPDKISEATINNLPFIPNEEQITLIHSLSHFVTSYGPSDIFILNGYAGTGKTSIVGALVKVLDSFRKKTIVLAPTGRAAKVAANLSGGKAFTIHKRLYRGNSSDPSNTNFFLAENRNNDTLFIIDEASLVTDGNSLGNSLLMQLCRHVYSGPGCAILMLGDIAQLPPVGQTESSAMDPARLRQIGLNPIFYSLIEPSRQTTDSGILYNATVIRHFLNKGFPIENFSIYKTGFSDVEIVDSHEFLDALSSSWAKVGKDETIVITRSNFRANNINSSIRRYLLDAEEPLMSGERIIISKNDYFWSRKNKLSNFLANGESAQVLKVGKMKKVYGRWFCDVELRIFGIDNPIEAKIILRSIVADGPSIPKDEMQRFYNRVLAAHEGELSEKIKAALEDPYYNALQVKYGYCITCHKAQGGQWKNVFIDLGGLGADFSDKDFYRWLYTAVTRASEKIYFINSPFDIS